MFDHRSIPRAAVPMIALLAGLLAGSAPSPAQPDGESTIGVLAVTLEHQPAGEALLLVRRLLSPLGTVELQPRDNTLVVRDMKTMLARIAPVLEQFDHPPQTLRFDVHLLRADNAGVDPNRVDRDVADDAVPEEVVERFRNYLKYDDYQLLAKAGITSREGEDVTYALGGGYNLSFRVGTVLAGQKLKLHDFRISRKPAAANANKSRQPEPRELIHTGLNLGRDRLFTMILAREAGPEQALVVALRFQLEDDPRGDDR